MCGIIGYVGKENPKGILLDGLRRLEYRGYDSAGVSIAEPTGVEVFRCEGRIENLEKKLIGKEFEGSVGIGHTRWATHGAPTEINAHPHRVGAITLVHNGIIENYLEHRAAIRKLGREVTSETDSEIVAHLFDLEIQAGRNLEQALENVLPQLKGSYAFVILSDQEPDLLLGVRNGAPLLVGLGEDENFVASDVQAILHRTKRIIYLDDHQAALCRRDGVQVRDSHGSVVEPEIQTINWTADQMEKQGYRHYMLKEIHEQPIAITQTIENNIDLAESLVRLEGLASNPEILENVRRVQIVACGTARHAGLVGKYLIERFARIPVDVDFGSEFRYRDPILDDGTLLVLISQSGETADTLAACQEGRARRIPTIAICNVRGSTLTREADAVLYTNAGPEIGVASTKAFTTQLVMLYMFAVELGMQRGALKKEDSVSLTKDLIQLPLLVDQALQMEKQIEEIALEQQDMDFFFYMGRGILYPIALEGALKLKEISYLHAEGYPAGELKHGPIALIDRNTSLIVISPKDRSYEFESAEQLNETNRTIYEKSMSNLQEVKSRGGTVYSVGSVGDNSLAEESRFFTGVPEAPWGLSPILMTIPIQFLAYYIALQKGTDVDKPRNLAKSVTVE